MPQLCPQLKQNLETIKTLKPELDLELLKLEEVFKDLKKSNHSTLRLRSELRVERKDLINKIKSIKTELNLNINKIEENFKFVGFSRLQNWLKKNDLEKHLDGGSLEKLMESQEKYYQKMYGADFKIDYSKIQIERSRLPNIKKALESGCANYPLLIATPEKLTDEEKEMTEVELAYAKLIEPLEKDAIRIWDKEGRYRWSKIPTKEVLKGYIPVKVTDFNVKDLESDWIKEVQRVINIKKSAPKAQENQIQLIFTDNRRDIPEEQKTINSKGELVENKYSFIEMIKAGVEVLTPQQWLVLASQAYVKGKTHLSLNTYNWMMAVLDHKGKKTDPPVSAASALSGSSGFCLDSNHASSGNDNYRCRAVF
jgi:hypothetical protein